MRRISKLAIIPLVVAGLMISGCSEKGEGVDVGNPLVNSVHAIGYVEPVGGVRGLSFEVSGVIARVDVEVGDMVEAGDPLMALLSEEEEAELDLERARLEVAQAGLALIKAGLHPDVIAARAAAMERSEVEKKYRVSEALRLEDLFKNEGVSRKERDLASYQGQKATAEYLAAKQEYNEAVHYVRDVDVAKAEADVRMSMAGLKVAESELRKMVLRAPSDGRVLEIVKREGEDEGGGAVIIFAPESRLRIRAEVDESFVGMVQVGQSVLITPRLAGSESVYGKVEKVKPVMGKKRVFIRDARERLDLQIFEVFIELEEDLATWPIGMEVDVEIKREVGR